MTSKKEKMAAKVEEKTEKTILTEEEKAREKQFALSLIS